MHEDMAARDPSKRFNRALFERLCRNLITNQTLCERLCQGVSTIKKKGRLPGLLTEMVNNLIQSIGLYDEPEQQTEWTTKVSPPWTLTSDKTRWRRDLSQSFTPSNYGSKTEQEIIAEAEAKIAKARRKQQIDAEFSRSRSVMKGSSRRSGSLGGPRSESAPPILPAIGGRRRSSGMPQLHSRQPLPVVSASPAITASRSSSHNFPRRLPASHELRSRDVMDASIDYEQVYRGSTAQDYQEPAASELDGQGLPNSNNSDPVAAAELFVSSQPVEGTFCSFGEL
eukprot:COSAG01_NODE_12605_length_1712_cov_1.074396_2_plen_283_part_00